MARNLEPKQVTSLAEFIKSKNCPNLSYDDWLDIEKSIMSSKYAIMDGFAEGLTQAMGGKTGSKAFEDLRNLDSEFRNAVEGLNINDIESKLKESKVLLPDLTKVLELAKEYKKERSEFNKKKR